MPSNRRSFNASTSSSFNSTCCLAEAVPKALLATQVLFGSPLDKIKGQDLSEAFENDPRMISLAKPHVADMSVDRVASESGLCLSKCKLEVDNE